jgi:paraquat-inducible protein B
MTDELDPSPSPDAAPAAVVEEKSGFSLVWVVPIVAVVIGAWLGWTALSERGPTIKITFDTGEGIEAGKTQLKYRDIQVGSVTAVDLAEDASHVIVTAELSVGSERYLTESTRFWVVRARVSAGQVTGLGTLLGGSYIGIDPVLEGESAREFVGLEVAPIVTTDEPGEHFSLRSDHSVSTGAPVYFRNIRVGEVVSSDLDDSGDFVAMRVFIRAPHHKRVRQNTRFWDASGFDVELSSEGVRVDSASLTSILIGGLAFDTPHNLSIDAPPRPDQIFRLFRSRAASEARTFTRTSRFLLFFEGSVQGLNPDAPVMFRGIPIGHVVDLKLEFDPEEFAFRIPVLIELEPERISGAEANTGTPRENMTRLVSQGLRAQLGSGNIITGAKQIEFDIHADAEPAELGEEGSYLVIPTLPTTLDELTANLTSIVQSIDALPLKELSSDVRSTLHGLTGTLRETEKLARSLNEDLTPGLEKALAQVETTLDSTNTLLSRESPTRRELQRTLSELAAAARSLRLLADYLEQHPESLIRGKETP